MTTHLSELIELGGSVATVATAYEAGLVDSLSRPAFPEEHAERLGLDPDAVEHVLDTLVALGVAETRDGLVGASDALAAAVGNPLDGLLPMQNLWRHLPRFLRTGERYAHMDGSRAERAADYKNVVGALGDLFEDAADDLAAKLPRPGERIPTSAPGRGLEPGDLRRLTEGEGHGPRPPRSPTRLSGARRAAWPGRSGEHDPGRLPLHRATRAHLRSDRAGERPPPGAFRARPFPDSPHGARPLGAAVSWS